MRLLKVLSTGDIDFTENLTENIPKYAILSHTWGKDEDEVTYADMMNGCAKRKSAYHKLEFCKDRVREDELDHFWIDTCCINKADSAELQHAITSMFEWYSNAEVCYALLSDVSLGKRDCEGALISYESDFRNSRWFKRGWTLQELIAPATLRFYSRERRYLHDKENLAPLIHEITTVPLSVLRGAPLTGIVPEEKFKWAAHRKTTRTEDKAYCLQGILGVHIAPLYGEGLYAFERLKNEVGMAIRSRLERSVPCNTSSNADRWANLLESLKFHDMDNGRSASHTALSLTCEWLLDTCEWRDWNDATKLIKHYGFFWMYGKPGAGKSTIMRFAYKHAEAHKSKDEIVLSFFFYARGSYLAKSTLGIYRALLYQLLSLPSARAAFADIVFPSNFTDEDYQWANRLLRSILQEVIRRLILPTIGASPIGKQSLKLFVDALDECNEDEVQEMIDFFEDIGEQSARQGGRFHVCFASRYYPVIDPASGVRMNLELQSGHEKDLTTYIARYLRFPNVTHIDEIQQEVQKKANGIFLWAALVVNILRDLIRAGRNHAVQQRLGEIPPGLSDLFNHIIKRDCEYMEDFKLCLQLILFATRPLSRDELYLAMRAGIGTDQQTSTVYDMSDVTDKTAEHFILSSSKGLAEVTRYGTKSKNAPKVQFIHESVRDFLIKEGGLSELFPELRGNFECLSHNEIKRCCETHIKIELTDLTADYVADRRQRKMIHDRWKLGTSPNSLTRREFLERLSSRYPFLTYAVQNVFYHADVAARTVDQVDFLTQFDYRKWFELNDYLVNFDNRLLHPSSTSSYALVANNCARLITLSGSFNIWAYSKAHKSYRYPFCAALAWRHREVAVALLKSHGVQDQLADSLLLPERPLSDKNIAPIAALCRGDNKAIVLELVKDERCIECDDIRLLGTVSQRGWLEVVDAVFSRTTFRTTSWIAATDSLGHIFEHASLQGQDDRISRVLQDCPDRIWSHKWGSNVIDTALCKAVEAQRTTTAEAILRFIVSKRANDFRFGCDLRLSSILLAAAQIGSSELLGLLSSYEFGKDELGTHLYSALTEANRLKLYNATEFLVQYEVSFMSKSRERDDPGLLLTAMQAQDVHILRLLLSSNAKSEFCDNTGLVLLLYMVKCGYLQAVNMLEYKIIQRSVQQLLVERDFSSLWWLYKEKIPISSLSYESWSCENKYWKALPSQLTSQFEKYDVRCKGVKSDIGMRNHDGSYTQIMDLVFQEYQDRNEADIVSGLTHATEGRCESVLELLEAKLMSASSTSTDERGEASVNDIWNWSRFAP